jgi:DNA-binding CsgD family transcriptional regulator
LLVWTLTGRELELGQIAVARSAGACGAVVTGDAGVGRTRLLEQALQDAAAAGAFIVRVRATRSSAELPLGAFANVIPQDTPADHGPGLFRKIADGIERDADGREIVIGVDDAHLLDRSSAALLLYLVEHGGIFAAVTTRSGERCPDAVTAIWKDAGGVRIELTGLREPELVEMVERALRGPLQRDARRWLVDTSAGSVLYARQLIDSALQTGALVDEQGLWRLTSEPPLPASLRQLTAERISTISAAQLAALELLAVGDPLRLSDAGELVDPDAITSLELNGLITVEPGPGGGTVRLADPLLTELVVAAIPASRAHSHRVRLAQRVAAHEPRTPADSLRIALWLTDAGESVPVATLLEAARVSRAAGGGFAPRFAKLAREAGAGVEAAMILAAAHVVNGRPDLAEQELARIEGQIDDPELATSYLKERAGVLQWGLDAGVQVMALLERAQRWWEDPAWQRTVQSLRLQIGAIVERPGTFAAELTGAITNSEFGDDEKPSLTRALAMDRFWTGAAREAETLISEDWLTMPLAGEVEFVQFATYVIVSLGSGSDLPALDQRMRDAFERALASGDPAAAGLAAAVIGIIGYRGGRIIDAQRWFNEAEAQSRRQDPFSVGRLVRSLQVGAALERGDADSARAAAARLAQALQDRRPLTRPVTPWVARGRAWARIAEGDRPQAQQILLDAADAAEWFAVFEAELRYEAMRAGVPARRLSARFEQLRASCDAPLTQAYAGHVAARAAGAAAEILAASEAFERLGANLYAAEAAAHAAAAFASEGRQDSARRAAARSRDLRPHDQGAVPLVIDGVDRDATELTPREAQMVELAAQGLSNPEIADRLVLSTRTVETHIYRAMRKLGVTDRREFKLGPIAG